MNGNIAANTLTAIYYPKGVNGKILLKDISDFDIILAGGLLSEIKGDYFRVGHMGSVSSRDLIATLSALEYALFKSGYKFETGISLKTFQYLII